MWDARTVPLAVSKECRRKIEKATKNDPEQRERVQETKRKRRDFVEKHANEQMDAVGSRGMKQKAEDNQETEPMEVMDCMCENANDVHIVEEDDVLEKYKAVNLADMTEEEHTEQNTFYDDLTGKALKHEKVIGSTRSRLCRTWRLGGWCL